MCFVRDLADKIIQNKAQIDWLEFNPENFLGKGGLAREHLQMISTNFRMVSHGVNLSIGGAEEINLDYLKSLKLLLDELNVPWWSDHLCFTTVKNKYVHNFLPLSPSREAVKHLVSRIKRVQDYIERPFLIENIAYYMKMPRAELSEAQFLAEVLEQADCGLLLDVNNLYVNACNLNYETDEFLKNIPLERTVEIHVAGHERLANFILDSHGAAVVEPVYHLLSQVLQTVPVKAVLLERETNLPEFFELLEELEKIRSIWNTRNSNCAPEKFAARALSKENPAHTAVGEKQTSLQLLNEAMHQLYSDERAREVLADCQNNKSQDLQLLLDSIPDISVDAIDTEGINRYAAMMRSKYIEVMSLIFPLCAKLLANDWSRIVMDYVKRFPPAHFDLNRMGERFVEYTKQSRNKYKFLPELADYEWLAMELYDCDTEVNAGAHAPILKNDEQLAQWRPLVNPVLHLRNYRFPIAAIVEAISREESVPPKVGKRQTWMVIYRDPFDKRTRPLELGMMAAKIIDAARKGTMSYLELFSIAKSELRNPQSDLVMSEFLRLTEHLHSISVFVGASAAYPATFD